MKVLIPLFVVVPLAAAFLIPVLAARKEGLAKYIANAAMLFLAVSSCWLILTIDQAPLVSYVGGWEPIAGIPVGISLVIDGLSSLLLCVINIIGFLAAFYAIHYISKYTGQKYFFALFMLMVAGMNGVVMAGDLFNLFVFVEISVIASYALVAFGVDKAELEASFKYQVMGGLASLLILMGIAMLYWQTKTLNMADLSILLATQGNTPFMLFTQFLLITGFGLKAALIPFHAWLPDAHSSAPSPISAMLSGVLIKAIGIYTILRIFFNIFALTQNISWLIITLGVLSMIIGVFLAIGQWDLKRLLAYHSISQMGYVVMGAGIGMLILARGGDLKVASLAIAGGLFHLINHAVFKGLLFLNAGAIEYRTGTRELSQMGGLAKPMPVTFATSLSASLAISGIPPFNGFFSKLLIIVAAVMGKFYLLGLFAVIVSIITLASFMKVQRYAFYGPPGKRSAEVIKDAPWTMKLSMIIMALMCLLMSLLIFPGIRESLLMPAVDTLTNTMQYAITILNH
ncbi:MAG: proton-conducting transporter membrane subunit [Bacteroidales bacterium]